MQKNHFAIKKRSFQASKAETNWVEQEMESHLGDARRKTNEGLFSFSINVLHPKIFQKSFPERSIFNLFAISSLEQKILRHYLRLTPGN